MNTATNNTIGAISHTNTAISCHVTNCHYNEHGGICSANQIQVGPQYAASAADTTCATFKPKH